MKASVYNCIIAWLNVFGLVWALLVNAVPAAGSSLTALALFVLVALASGAASAQRTEKVHE